MKLRFVVLLILLLAPSVAVGSENCGMMNGQCRDACNTDEEAHEGAFIDCGEKQECCVPKPPSKDRKEDSGKSGKSDNPAAPQL